MPARGASLVSVLSPVKFLAVTHLTEITGKRSDFQEAQKREELSNSVLHGGSRKTPFVVGLQGEARTSNTGGSLLNAMSFIENETMIVDGMDDAFTIFP